MGTARRPGQSDSPDDPYAQTTPARPVFAVEPEAGSTAGYDAGSLRHAADIAPLSPHDQTRSAQPAWAAPEPAAAHTAMMPGPRNVTRAVPSVSDPPFAPMGPRADMPATVAHPAVAAALVPPTPSVPSVVPATPRPRSSMGLMIALVLVGVTLGVGVAVIVLVR